MNSGAHVLKLISECFFFFSLVYWLDKQKQNFLLVKKTESASVQSATSTVTASARSYFSCVFCFALVFCVLLLCFVFFHVI